MREADRIALNEIRKMAGSRVPDFVWAEIEKQVQEVGLLGLSATAKTIVEDVVTKHGSHNQASHGRGNGSSGSADASEGSTSAGSNGGSGGGAAGGETAEQRLNRKQTTGNIDEPEFNNKSSKEIASTLVDRSDSRDQSARFKGGVAAQTEGGVVAVKDGEAVFASKYGDGSRSGIKQGSYKGREGEKIDGLADEIEPMLRADRPRVAGKRNSATRSARRLEDDNLVALRGREKELVDAVGGPDNARALIALGRTGKAPKTGGVERKPWRQFLVSAGSSLGSKYDNNTATFATQAFMALGAMRAERGD